MKRVSRVLLVDDNPADIDLTSDLLARSGHSNTVSAVMDGEQAIAYLSRQGKYAGVSPPDLVLLDLNLPRKDGRVVLAEMKANPALRHTPIVVLSTSRASTDVAQSYALGANSYLCKPGSLHEYVAVITSLGDFWFGCALAPGMEDR
jgi:chemotaxis family two-component system response regulator Rcp1